MSISSFKISLKSYDASRFWDGGVRRREAAINLGGMFYEWWVGPQLSATDKESTS